MARLKTSLWVSALVRRINDRGDFCVISRKGDPDAGQIWVEVDHLNGTMSLYSPAPANPDAEGREFVLRFDRVEATKIGERLAQEAEFDPDFWVVSIETRNNEIGLEVVSSL